MSVEEGNDLESSEGCVVPVNLIPAEELSRYSVESDVHAGRDIASYVNGQAPDEEVLHVEKLKRETVIGESYDIWDVTTDKDRYWVLTNLTNLYSQRFFPSLDYTISFHIGLMMRLKSRPEPIANYEPTPFDEVFRRMDQADERHESAVELEDFQAVGMLLREALVCMIEALRTSTEMPEAIELPQKANFLAWNDLLMNQLCGGGSNKELRQHLKNIGKEAWQLVNWLTHSKSGGQMASSIAIHTCRTVIGNSFQILERDQEAHLDTCPTCKSRDVRRHFDIHIPPEGAYYHSCGVCKWTDYPDLKADSDPAEL